MFIIAQNKFEKGEAVKLNGEQVNCLIKNEDWITVPTQFEYKLSESSEIKTGTIDEFKSFRIGKSFKYVKETIDVDRDIEKQPNNSGLTYQDETLFLKLIVEGRINLYHLEDEKLNIFFMKSQNSGEIIQLKHKTYFDDKYKLRENNSFRKQLYDAFNDFNIKIDEIKNTNYNINDLKSIFEKYNKAAGSYRIYFNKTKINYNVYAKAGLSSIKYLAQGGEGITNIAFTNETTFRAGAELEMVLPYSKAKWSVFVSPMYQSYSSEASAGIAISDNPSALTNFNAIEYESIELPIGIRRYFFSKTADNFRLYANAAYVFDIGLSGNLILIGEDRLLRNNRGLNFMLGGGIQFNDFGLEFLYFSPRDLANSNPGFVSDYKSIAINFTYNFL